MEGVTLTPRNMQLLFNALSVPKARQVCVKTLNDMGRDAEKAAIVHQKKTYNLRGSIKKRGFKRERANNYRLKVRLNAEFSRTDLMDIKGTKQGKAGVQTAVRAGQRKTISSSFITHHTGEPRAFMRTGPRPYPIRKITTLSPGKMISTKEAEPIYIDILKHKTDDYFKKHLAATIPGLLK